MLGGEENKTQQQVIPLAGRERESQMQLLTSRDRTQLSVEIFLSRYLRAQLRVNERERIESFFVRVRDICWLAYVGCVSRDT